MRKKTVSMFMGLVLGVTTVFSSIGPAVVTVSAAAAESGVTDSSCTNTGTAEPASDDVVPDANQYKYQKDELAAFCHFGPNTFNEIEWGEHYGDKKPSEIFRLNQKFDAETMVSTLKSAGFKKLIITAKHHDGFCIWPSEYTDYDAEAAGYKGDILEEISTACTKHGMDMGLYLSPWDIHEPSYGYKDANGNPTTPDKDVKDYNEYYNNQLKEILGNEKYGNKGRFVEVWMDGAKGSGANAQEYDFNTWFETIQKYEGKEVAGNSADCMLFGAQAYTTVRWIGNEDGVAFEDTWAKSNVNYKNNTIDSNGSTPYSKGYETGNKWTVPECDGRITSGWFWGTKKNTPKTITQLANMYFDSVGHNATMLLNVPPNNQGTVDQPILNRVKEFGENVEETFRTNLAKAKGTTIEASNVRGNDTAFKPGNVVDAKDETYWTTEDGTKEGSLTIKWDKAKKFDVVSIEEAIQKGQHINSYKVEYKASNEAPWQTLKSGETVGAKRLVRTPPVSATQVKITVGTSDGKVPMLSEVGVYKASEGFQLAGAAPEGMDTTSVNETSKFTFSPTGWNPQTGSQYINGQNTWSNQAGADFTFKFHGTKAYLMGTTDPGHGQADVYIDGEKVKTINTRAESRSTGAKIFESEDLTDADHTLRLVAKTDAAIGVEAAYVINNGGVGMIELEKDAYTMNEKEELTVKVKRVGGSNGKLTAKIQPNPGSAIQNDFNTEYAPDVIFEAGETEKSVVAAKTKQNTAITGDRVFSIELTEKTPKNAIIGFNGSARITIKDADGITKDKLQTLVTNSAALEEHLYSEGWDAFAKALKTAQEVVENESATDATIRSAYTELDKAKAALKVREKYTENDRFNFPWRAETSAKLEAEFATELKDDPTSDAKYPMKIDAKNDASNGKFVTDMAANDVLKYAYHADKAGTYQVVMRYRSGSAENAKNSIKITEAKGKIKDQEVIVDPKKENDNVVFGTVTFDIEVVKPGDGMIVITPPEKRDGLDGKGPGIDYFIISPKNVVLEKFAITATAGEGGTITAESLTEGKVDVTEGESATFTITPNSGYEIADVKVDGESIGKKTSYTFKDVAQAHKIEATFAFANYTAENPFIFPETKGVTSTLEAEHATELINSNDSDSDPKWPLTITSESWASNGKFLNCMAYKDYAKYAYTANVPGIYKVTGTYRAGALNKLAFSEEGSKIEAAQVDCPSTKEGNNLTVKTFELNIEVKTAGAGTLVLTAPDTNKAPQLDKLDIQLIRTASEADLTELQTAITNAEAILNAADKDKYSAAALVELQELVNAGKQLTTESSQADVDAKKAEITAKIADIQTQFTITATAGNGGKIAPTGATNVYKGTSKAFTITPNDGYHVDSLTVDGTAVDVVTEYTFSDVTANHTIAVTFAKDAMTVAKENLLAAINTANEKLAQTDAYTPASLEALQNAVDEAQTVYNKADATQTEVDNAKANVEAKIAALKEKADKSALRLAVKAAEGEAALTDKYTEESIAALQTAIDAANRVLADDNATQAEVDAQVEAVNAAKAALEEKKAPVVKEELEKAVADATEVVGATDKYTEASLAALQSAIDAANAVLQNSDATQDEIDAAVQAVKEARAALKAKDDDKKDDSNKDDDKKDDNNGSDNNGGNNNGNANNGSNNNGSFNNGSSNNGTANGTSNVAKAAKTGDTSNVAGMAMLCLAAGLVAVMARRKRTN